MCFQYFPYSYLTFSGLFPRINSQTAFFTHSPDPVGSRDPVLAGIRAAHGEILRGGQAIGVRLGGRAKANCHWATGAETGGTSGEHFPQISMIFMGSSSILHDFFRWFFMNWDEIIIFAWETYGAKWPISGGIYVTFSDISLLIIYTLFLDYPFISHSERSSSHPTTWECWLVSKGSHGSRSWAFLGLLCHRVWSLRSWPSCNWERSPESTEDRIRRWHLTGCGRTPGSKVAEKNIALPSCKSSSIYISIKQKSNMIKHY